MIYSLQYTTPLPFVIEWKSFLPNMVVGLGEENVLWGVSADVQSEYHEFEKSISNISVKIQYSSVYGDKYESMFNTDKFVNNNKIE